MIEPVTAMLGSNRITSPQPHIETRRSFLSLRWLLIILASYLTVFSYVGAPAFNYVFAFALLFAASNSALSLLPVAVFQSPGVQRGIIITDVVFVSGAFFLLRQPETYFYVPFVLVFLLAVIWRDLRVVLFSVLVVSLLYGTFASFKLIQPHLDPDIEKFLTLALFFVVAIFYVFLSDKLQEDARLAWMIVEEKRRAEVMVEITSSISSSLNSQEILYLIVTRLREVFGATECSIIRMDPKGLTAQT